MRLDQYLAKRKNKLNRSNAKHAIKLGFVYVNKSICTKPAYELKAGDVIEVTNKKLAKMPASYFKLVEIQKKINLIKETDAVLVLDTVKSGYAYAASELAKKVFHIEPEKLAKAWPSEITGGENVDLILNDLVLDWHDSIAAMHSVLPLLKPAGQVLMTVKFSKKVPGKLELAKAFEPHGLKVVKSFKLGEKREFYVVLKRD